MQNTPIACATWLCKAARLVTERVHSNHKAKVKIQSSRRARMPVRDCNVLSHKGQSNCNSNGEVVGV